MRHTMIVIALPLAAASAAAPAFAGQFGLFWRSVDNTIGNPATDAFEGAQWQTLSQHTFDLLLLGDPFAQIRGANLVAEDASTTHLGLRTNGRVFNHTLGGDIRSGNFEALPGFNAIRYDTYVALGSVFPGPAISFTGPVDLDADGVTDQLLSARWFAESGAALDGNGEMRLMRVTVGVDPGVFNPFQWNSGVYLGSPSHWGPSQDETPSWMRIELIDGGTVDLQIPNAFQALSPTPGATTLLALAGLAGLRRRR